jgi:hypothetical protein
MCSHAQEASSLTEYDLMMVPHLLTMRMRSRTLEEYPVQNLGRKEESVYAWYFQGPPSCEAQKWFKKMWSKPSPRAQMRDLTILLASYC